MGVFYAVPQAWLKIAWGLSVGAVAYLVLRRLQSAAGGSYDRGGIVASRRSSAATYSLASSWNRVERPGPFELRRAGVA